MAERPIGVSVPVAPPADGARPWRIVGFAALALFVGCGEDDPKKPAVDADSNPCAGEEDGVPCGEEQHCSRETCEPNECGDGFSNGDEECDDGNQTDGDGCSALCEAESDCGNGKVEAGEECDDGNSDSGDGCSARCEKEGKV